MAVVVSVGDGSNAQEQKPKYTISSNAFEAPKNGQLFWFILMETTLFICIIKIVVSEKFRSKSRFRMGNWTREEYFIVLSNRVNCVFVCLLQDKCWLKCKWNDGSGMMCIVHTAVHNPPLFAWICGRCYSNFFFFFMYLNCKYLLFDVEIVFPMFFFFLLPSTQWNQACDEWANNWDSV